MKVLHITNLYRSKFGGEVTVFNFITEILIQSGHKACLYTLDSKEIDSYRKKFSVFFSCIYSFREKARLGAYLAREKPDVVHVHNVYPLFSPSIFDAMRKHNLPVVMHLHNYGLTCPVGLHYVDGQQCERCVGGKEYWGILRNCAGSRVKSFNYALRSMVARKLSLFVGNVDVFIAVSDFSRSKHLNAVVNEQQIRVLKNAVTVPPVVSDAGERLVIGYAGRLEPIKGVDIFISIARRFPRARFEVAGDGPLFQRSAKEAPENVTFLGPLSPQEMSDFYSRCRLLVFPTQVFEGLPLTVLEAMAHAVPVVASKLGALGEAVDDGITGFLCDPRNLMEWIRDTDRLLSDDQLCTTIGKRGREKVIREFNASLYYTQLMDIYEDAIQRAAKRKVS